MKIAPYLVSLSLMTAVLISGCAGSTHPSFPNVEVISTYARAVPADKIDEFEKEVGGQLPRGYREFMMELGPGDIDVNLHVISPDDIRKDRINFAQKLKLIREANQLTEAADKAAETAAPKVDSRLDSAKVFAFTSSNYFVGLKEEPGKLFRIDRPTLENLSECPKGLLDLGTILNDKEPLSFTREGQAEISIALAESEESSSFQREVIDGLAIRQMRVKTFPTDFGQQGEIYFVPQIAGSIAICGPEGGPYWCVFQFDDEKSFLVANLLRQIMGKHKQAQCCVLVHNSETVEKLSPIADKMQLLLLKSPGVTARAFNTLTRCEALEVLGFEYCLIDSWQNFPKLPKLKSLSIANTETKEDTIKYFQKQANLTNLVLHDCHVSAEGLQNIEDLPIHALDLSCSDANDDIAKALPEICPDLEFLSLANTDVTQQGVAELSKLKRLSQLSLAGIKVSTEERDKLLSAIPGLQLSFSGSDKYKELFQPLVSERVWQ